MYNYNNIESKVKIELWAICIIIDVNTDFVFIYITAKLIPKQEYGTI